MKFIEECVVLSQKEISPGIFDMTLQTEHIAENASAGQFVSLYCNNGSRLLPRPISICGTCPERGSLRLVYRVTGKGTGTEEFSKLKKSDTIRVEGPLGNGFDTDISAEKTVLIIGGGIGIPPMLETAKRISGRKKIILGYRDDLFLFDEFEKLGEVYASTEDGSYGTRGNVLDLIREKELTGDLIYACGPRPMLKALKTWAEEEKITCYLSMEERMACGIGACLACVCASSEKDPHTNVHNKRVCREGPVFLSTEVEL